MGCSPCAGGGCDAAQYLPLQIGVDKNFHPVTSLFPETVSLTSLPYFRENFWKFPCQKGHAVCIVKSRTDAAPSWAGSGAGNCRWPFTCCNKNRPKRVNMDEHGSRRKSPRSPPSGGGKDMESPAPTPKRSKAVGPPRLRRGPTHTHRSVGVPRAARPVQPRSAELANFLGNFQKRKMQNTSLFPKEFLKTLVYPNIVNAHI